MVIKYPASFNNNLPAGFDGVFKWDYLIFPRNISPMDIDGNVEINGNFLMFETKDTGVDIPPGQFQALSRLVWLGNGRITVIFLWGKDIPWVMQVLTKSGDRNVLEPRQPTNRAHLVEYVKLWAELADKQRYRG
jgi:hypothetical protein